MIIKSQEVLAPLLQFLQTHHESSLRLLSLIIRQKYWLSSLIIRPQDPLARPPQQQILRYLYSIVIYRDSNILLDLYFLSTTLRNIREISRQNRRVRRRTR